MKKVLFLSLTLLSVMLDGTAFAAPAARGGRATAGRSTGGAAATTSAPKTMSARAATGAKTAPKTGGTAATTGKTGGRTMAARGGTSASTGAAAPKGPTVSARAATTQKVVGTGTKVAGAAKNIVVSEECQAKYEGCMDSFCMIDNDSGGRCVCSDKNAELDAIFAEIEKLDEQSYQMATLGVEKLEMGDSADEVIAAANAAANAAVNSVKKEEAAEQKKKARKALDLSMWDAAAEFEDEEDVFAASAVDADSLDNKEGDALHKAAAALCKAQIPECAKDINMLQMMYGQKIKSDCTAYENVLKQKKTQSAQKLQAAERALRETALEQYQNANKYDLGQCTIKFKECMQTTAGCGDDFSKCATTSAMDATNTKKSTSKKTKNYFIKGATTTIEVSASTYDALMAKKPLCESVTKQCTKVAGQVWDTFLKEVAPQLKTAEIIAEDNARQDCIGNISACFQKGCKDSIDPKDPDGSYDMCLSRPEAMLNICKIPLNNCGISAVSAEEAQKSIVWDFVVARLAAMRVDSCTMEVKECLQSDDRCGADYSNCLGLDTDSIVRMCPYDKLVGCQKVYGESNIRDDAVYDEVAKIAQGIMLNIDNEMMTQCQKAADAAMIKVCGSAEDCSNLTIDENSGARSLEYKICEYTFNAETNQFELNYNACRNDINMIQDTELGRKVGGVVGEDLGDGASGSMKAFAGVIDGTIYWDSVNFDPDTGKLMTIDEYMNRAEYQDLSSKQKERIASELAILQRNIDMAIQSIEADPKVQFCLTGREVQGMVQGDSTQKIGRGASGARFPGLTKQMRMIIANQALKIAKDNYYKKYDELDAKMKQDYIALGERVAEIQGENVKDARREMGRAACVDFAEFSALPKAPKPPKNALGTILGGIFMAGAVAAIPFTGGASAAAVVGITTAGTIATSVAAGGAVLGATMAVGGIMNKQSGAGEINATTKLTGAKSTDTFNYQETVTSTYKWDTMECETCVRARSCKKIKNPLFGSKYCKEWNDEINTCRTTQF